MNFKVYTEQCNCMNVIIHSKESSKKPKTAEHKKHIKRRLELWRQVKLFELLTEREFIQT